MEEEYESIFDTEGQVRALSLFILFESGAYSMAQSGIASSGG